MQDVETINQGSSRDLITEDTAQRLKEILRNGTAENSLLAYRKDCSYFMAWALITTGYEVGFPVPCPLVIRFIVDHLQGLDEQTDKALCGMGVKAKPGTHSLNTVSRRIASLSTAHENLHVDNPCRSKEVRTLLSKAKRGAVKNGVKPKKKSALTRDLLELLLSTCDDSLSGIRDRAILCMGWSSGGRRRAEISGARLQDLTRVEGGFVFHLGHSKTDQDGSAGLNLPILGRAAIALNTWIKAGQISSGRLFRGITKGGKITEDITDKAIALIVKKRASLAGLDPSLFSGHSLRSGFLTESGRQGMSLSFAMELSGHRTVSVALGYFQAGNAVNNPCGLLLG